MTSCILCIALGGSELWVVWVVDVETLGDCRISGTPEMRLRNEDCARFVLHVSGTLEAWRPDEK